MLIIIHSGYGHILELAQEMKKGVEKNKHVTATIYTVPETLPEKVQTKMSLMKHVDLPVIDAHDPVFGEADGYLFGISTRFGTMSAQMKSFLDSTGQHWQAGTLKGKLAGVFTSANTQHGGLETAALCMVPFFAHQGMVFVSNGYAHESMFSVAATSGSTPYGAGMVKDVHSVDLGVAFAQGQNFGAFVKRLKK